MASRLARPLTIPNEEEIDLYEVMSALTDPVRRALVRHIAATPGGPCSTSDFGVSKSTLTRHWRVLREAGLIRQEVHGTRHRNWLRREEIDRRFPGLLALVLDQPGSGPEVADR
ncbi:helix-turn-helix transcriptional regulator [Streptomyces sp. GbtcB6]|uniref:ArsR/SmtB family transcription factor n=1 Tax=Streptomyces sp. GbtcB6 TaxID=2824751 RepID=UPI001C2FF40A|nr:helix-turn-helix domain-containing protein [Streptomyces sp. GbtcB6]